MLIEQLSGVSMVLFSWVRSYRSSLFQDFVINEMLVLLRKTVDRQLVDSSHTQYCT